MHGVIKTVAEVNEFHNGWGDAPSVAIFIVRKYIPPEINGVFSSWVISTDFYQPNVPEVQLGILSSTVCYDATLLVLRFWWTGSDIMLVHIYCTANDLSIEKLTVDSLVQTTTFFPFFFSCSLSFRITDYGFQYQQPSFWSTDGGSLCYDVREVL